MSEIPRGRVFDYVVRDTFSHNRARDALGRPYPAGRAVGRVSETANGRDISQELINAHIERRDALIASRDAHIEHRDALIASRDALIASRDAHRKYLALLIEQRDAHIEYKNTLEKLIDLYKVIQKRESEGEIEIIWNNGRMSDIIYLKPQDKDIIVQNHNNHNVNNVRRPIVDTRHDVLCSSMINNDGMEGIDKFRGNYYSRTQDIVNVSYDSMRETRYTTSLSTIGAARTMSSIPYLYLYVSPTGSMGVGYIPYLSYPLL